MLVIKEVNDLPNEIKDIIFDYIPNYRLVFINKFYYNLYHNLLTPLIQNYESYVRDIIRRDNSFVFVKIINENIHKWIKKKIYSYKNMIFNNPIYFIMYYCVENNSENCRKLLHNYLIKHDLCRNLHKKKVIKYIKWNN
jgi:hypothetical protein